MTYVTGGTISTVTSWLCSRYPQLWLLPPPLALVPCSGRNATHRHGRLLSAASLEGASPGTHSKTRPANAPCPCPCPCRYCCPALAPALAPAPATSAGLLGSPSAALGPPPYFPQQPGATGTNPRLAPLTAGMPLGPRPPCALPRPPNRPLCSRYRPAAPTHGSLASSPGKPPS